MELRRLYKKYTEISTEQKSKWFPKWTGNSAPSSCYCNDPELQGGDWEQNLYFIPGYCNLFSHFKLEEVLSYTGGG